MHKYENYYLFNLFPEIFKIKQISLMKDILLNSNKNSNKEKNNEKKNDNNNHHNSKNKNSENKYEYINFYFIIEEIEGDNIYFRLLKLDLYFVVLKNIDLIFYLNGVYKIEKNIIITKKSKEYEYLYHFVNKDLIYKTTQSQKENKLKIKIINGKKYLANKKLIQEKNALKGYKHFKVYEIVIQTRKNNYNFFNKQIINQLKEDEQKINSETNDN